MIIYKIQFSRVAWVSDHWILKPKACLSVTQFLRNARSVVGFAKHSEKKGFLVYFHHEDLLIIFSHVKTTALVIYTVSVYDTKRFLLIS